MQLKRKKLFFVLQHFEELWIMRCRNQMHFAVPSGEEMICGRYHNGQYSGPFGHMAIGRSKNRLIVQQCHFPNHRSFELATYTSIDLLMAWGHDHLAYRFIHTPDVSGEDIDVYAKMVHYKRQLRRPRNTRYIEKNLRRIYRQHVASIEAETMETCHAPKTTSKYKRIWVEYYTNFVLFDLKMGFNAETMREREEGETSDEEDTAHWSDGDVLAAMGITFEEEKSETDE